MSIYTYLFLLWTHKCKQVETKLISAEARVLSDKIRPVQKYAVRFLENSADCQAATHAEAPPTPDRVSESGLCEFWEEQFEEVCSMLFTCLCTRGIDLVLTGYSS